MLVYIWGVSAQGGSGGFGGMDCRGVDAAVRTVGLLLRGARQALICEGVAGITIPRAYGKDAAETKRRGKLQTVPILSIYGYNDKIIRRGSSDPAWGGILQGSGVVGHETTTCTPELCCTMMTQASRRWLLGEDARTMQGAVVKPTST